MYTTTRMDKLYFEVEQNDVKGYYPAIYIPQDAGVISVFNNDYLMAEMLNVFPKQYSDFLKEYGAIGPRNIQTYFLTEAEAKYMITILEEIYKQNNLLEEELKKKGIDNSATRESIKGNSILAYKNSQSYQGIPEDINTTTKDSKDQNSEHGTMLIPASKGSHYTIL